MRTFDREYLRRDQYRDSSNLGARQLLHKLFSNGAQSWNDFIFEQLKFREGMRVLEVGCGNAVQWRVNQHNCPQSLTVVLTDFSLGMLREAGLSLGDDPRFAYCCQDGMSLGFSQNEFDLVIANHMLYHVPDIDAALWQAAHVLRPDGRMVCATNGPEHMRDLDKLLHAFEPRYSGSNTMSDRFNLVNGEAQLNRYFKRVDLVLYPSDLWVTDASLLSDYAYSTPRVKEVLNLAQVSDLTRFFQKKIDSDGGIYIRKQTGVFIGSEPTV